jgi:hypothetical protein
MMNVDPPPHFSAVTMIFFAFAAMGFVWSLETVANAVRSMIGF